MRLINAVVAALCLFSTSALGQARPKKIIVTGWDSPTTAQFRRDIGAMQNAPFDGTALWVKAKGDLPQGLNSTPFRTAFSRISWKRKWFQHAVADLKAVEGKTGNLTDNFLRLDANPGDVDWFDDAGWQAIVEHFRLAAWIAKEGGIKGLVFDAEPYTKPFVPFDPKTQPEAAKHTFAQYRAKARQRGREVMRAIAKEFPDAVLLTFFMQSYLIESNRYHGPTITDSADFDRALYLHSYGLYPAFIDGWLDALPPAMTLVDGNEHGYGYTTQTQFHAAAAKIKGAGQELIAPENRAKYRNQVQAGVGIYVDAHYPPFKNPDELPGASLKLFGQNVASALKSVDEYVWFWGESGRWWTDPKELLEWEGKEVAPLWESLMPGIGESLRIAKNPQIYAEAQAWANYEKAVAAGAKNLSRNFDFGIGADANARSGASSDWQTKDVPAEWSAWQAEFSKGKFDWDEIAKSARASHIKSGVFLQTIEAKPGEKFFIVAQSKTQGKGVATLTVGWKRADSSWLPDATRKTVLLPRRELPNGWSQWGTEAVAPEGTGLLVVLLGIEGQTSDNDMLWWDDIKVIRYEGTSR